MSASEPVSRSRRRRRGLAAIAAALVVAGSVAFVAASTSARAQPVEEGRPTHLSLGGAAASTTDQDRRLPRGTLRIAWKTHVASALRGPALVHPGEPIVVADEKGSTLYFLKAGGEVDHHVTFVAPQAAGIVGAPLRLTDGTLVAVSATGDVFGCRRGELRFRTSLGASVRGTPAALALDDGGFVLGIEAELVYLDASGGIVGRTSLPDPLSGELAVLDGRSASSGGAKLAGITSSGLAVLVRPGGDVRSAGELGTGVSGLLGVGRTLTAIRDGARLVDLDVVTGQVRTRDEARGTAQLLGAPVRSAASFSVAELDGPRLSLLTYPLAPGAADPRRLRLAVLPNLAAADAGAATVTGTSAPRPGAASAPPSPAPDVLLVTDETGVFAFAVGTSSSSLIGVADVADGSVTTLDKTVCPGGGGGRGAEVAGLAVGDHALVVTCASGDVVELVQRSGT